jgi:tetratricopeptide (TPR) repeat protein
VTHFDSPARLLSPAQAFDAALALHRQGRLAEAEQLYEGVLELDRQHVGSLHNLGLIRLRQERLQEAASLLRRVTDLQPREASAHNSLGAVLRATGEHADAVRHFEQAIALAPDLAAAHGNLGHALLALGRAEAALAQFDKALALDGRDAASLGGKGGALLALQRAEDAARCYEAWLALDPDNAHAHNNLGAALQALGRAAEAMAAYERAVALDPTFADAHVNLAKALHRLGRPEAALAHSETALALRPNDAAAENDLGNALQSLGRHGDAVARYERALALRPDLAAAHGNLGNSLHALDRSEAAIAHYQRAIAGEPGNATFHSNLGTALRELGHIDAARRAFATAVTLAPGNALFQLNLAEVKRFTADDPQLPALEALAQSGSASPELHFALGKARADLQDYAASFRHLLQANALRRREINYDEAAALARFERIRAVFTPELLHRLHALGDPSEVPVFIIGMPRSGTTLVEQILASHRQIFGAGEIAAFGDAVAAHAAFPEAVQSLNAAALRRLGRAYVVRLCALAPGARRITDKMPSNFLLAGLIHLALPKARVVHVRRDPVDTCLSCFATLFTAGQHFAYDLSELARYYLAYESLMAHWRRVLPEGAWLELRYEDIVGDLEREARRLIAYCGLDWDDRCLGFHATKRPVRTASATAVREPIYRRSVGRWRRYGALLDPLVETLEGVRRDAR